MGSLRAAFDPVHADKNIFRALLDARAEHGGDREIIHDADDRCLTYDSLVQASFALGAALKKGTRYREVVALMLPTSAAGAVSFFGLSAYGRIPAMLNFTAGAKALTSALKLASIRRIVTARAFIEKGELHALIDELSKHAEVVYLEDVKERLGLNHKAAAVVGPLAPWAIASMLRPEEPGVILFTSGTEGEPKGVVLSHRNLAANVHQVFNHVPDALGVDEVMYNPLPIFHCFGLTGGLLLPVLTGVKVALHPSPLQSKTVAERIKSTKATLLLSTDTFVNQYIRASSDDELSGLKFVVCGAERVRDETRQSIRRKFGVELLEGYGATEAAPVISLNQPGHNRPGTVGRPLPGIELKLEPQEGIPEGGRLLVRGPNVMDGYLIPGQSGGLTRLTDGWHDTGDVVAVDDFGAITIRGRLKRFAKIGGEMVSLGVVENVASTLWRDHEHAAAVLPDGRKGEQIVLLTTNPKADRMELVRWSRDHGVNELSLPRKILHVGSIPVLGTGKMDIGGVQRLAAELASAAERPGGVQAAE
jgi:acyl-[acyl-carrier-protein]-phospholipid O-acyltransferase / long-chain-fatty-acid--[acyl-carrier-protein] ligase